jgi:UDP-hydrolysing UDP-N-acetyl-D-glucosamine 2-epimerase
MNKKILTVSTSRSDRYLLEPVVNRLGEECKFIRLRNLYSPYTEEFSYDQFVPEIRYILGESEGCKGVVLLGDRHEVCLLAYHFTCNEIPIYHLHGGEVTAGSKDEYFRHAITKMAGIHLTAHQDFADRVIRMGENPKNVFVCGALGVHRAKQISLPEKENLLTVILHPNTTEPEKTESEITTLLDALKSFTDRFRIKFYAPNYDNGREIIECKMRGFCELYGCEYIEEEYGDDFLRSLASSKCIIGNSSCGVIEAPSLKVPAINIGMRQDGRPMAGSVVNFGVAYPDSGEIRETIKLVLKEADDLDYTNPYDSTENDTVDMICDIIRNHPVEFKKRFVD